MPDVKLADVTFPEGVSRKTHFICVRGTEVVAIERTPAMLLKAKETVKAKTLRRKTRAKKRMDKEKGILQRQAERVAVKKSKLTSKLAEIEKNEAKRKAKLEAELNKL